MDASSVVGYWNAIYPCLKNTSIHFYELNGFQKWENDRGQMLVLPFPLPAIVFPFIALNAILDAFLPALPLSHPLAELISICGFYWPPDDESEAALH